MHSVIEFETFKENTVFKKLSNPRPIKRSTKIIDRFKIEESELSNGEIDDKWSVKITKSYQEVTDGLNVRPGDSVIFLYHVKNRCGLHSNASAFYEYVMDGDGYLMLQRP